MTSAHDSKPSRLRRSLPILISAVLAVALNTALSNITDLGILGRIFVTGAIFVVVSLIAEAISRRTSRRRSATSGGDSPTDPADSSHA